MIPLLEDVQAMHRAQKFGFEFNFRLGNLICVLEILLSRIEESGFGKKCTEQESRDFKRVCDFFGLLNQSPDSVRESLHGKLEQMIMARMRLQVSGVLCGME